MQSLHAACTAGAHTQVIGRGAYGKVHLAQSKVTNQVGTYLYRWYLSPQYVALKSIKKSRFQDDEESDIKSIWVRALQPRWGFALSISYYIFEIKMRSLKYICVCFSL